MTLDHGHRPRWDINNKLAIPQMLFTLFFWRGAVAQEPKTRSWWLVKWMKEKSIRELFFNHIWVIVNCEQKVSELVSEWLSDRLSEWMNRERVFYNPVYMERVLHDPLNIRVPPDPVPDLQQNNHLQFEVRLSHATSSAAKEWVNEWTAEMVDEWASVWVNQRGGCALEGHKNGSKFSIILRVSWGPPA